MLRPWGAVRMGAELDGPGGLRGVELGWLWDTGSDGASLCPPGQPLLEQEYNGNPDSVGYRIRYARSDGRGRAALHVVHDRVEREYTIEDLEEWTEYRVQVQAFNAIGSGPWSHLVLGRTRESGTAEPPRHRVPTVASPDADPSSCPQLLSPTPVPFQCLPLVPATCRRWPPPPAACWCDGATSPRPTAMASSWATR